MKYDGIMQKGEKFYLVRTAVKTWWAKGEMHQTNITKYSLGHFTSEEAAQVQLDKSQS